MNKEKLIRFLKFIGIQNDSLTEQINDSKFDLTDNILIFVSKKKECTESFETLSKWYIKYD